jgi:hypothetical protein
MSKPPLIVNGQRIVKIGNEYPDIGPYRLQMWVVRDLHSRTRLSPRLVSRQAAAQWVTDQGWRYIGTQEKPLREDTGHE